MVSEAIAELVRSALEKALIQEGEVRLISKGATQPGLFPGGAASKQKTDAINACFSHGLLEKTREVEEGKGKSAKTTTFVKLTRSGMRAVFENLPIERAKEILSAVAPASFEEANQVFFEVAAQGIQKLQAELASLLKKENEVFGILQDMITQRTQFIAASKVQMEKELEQIRTLAQPHVPSPRADQASVRESRPKSEGDMDFQRDQSEQLVFAWQDADAQTKQALENVMFNLGLEPLGERGQDVDFDGRLHDTDDVVEVGERVVVTEPGWRYANPRGVYLICKTKVKRKDL
jgi:hypothetical protein